MMYESCHRLHLMVLFLFFLEHQCKQSKTKKLKIVLMWTQHYAPIETNGQINFIQRKCQFQNCYLTSNKTFTSFKNYDAVIFHGPHLKNDASIVKKVSAHRSPNQTFIFFTFESPANYPICHGVFDNFFNVTWTYKLDSDIVYKYFVIRNKTTGAIIAPSRKPRWLEINKMKPISDDLDDKLSKKFKAAAWIVSRCTSLSKREEYVAKLQAALQDYNLDVDVYGYCGSYWVCGNKKMMLPDCWEMIETDYYFYLSFENSFAIDYVTEKLINPIQHYTVPVVYGGANYTRFLPPGSYLNAMELKPNVLADLMYELMSDPKKYFNYFRWHNHYSAHVSNETADTDNYCSLCKFFNDEGVMNSYFYHDNLRDWYSPQAVCK